MTENKRFVPIFDGFDKRVVGAKDNGKIISFMDMFNLLNELNDENKELKAENNRLIKTTADVVAEHQRKVFDLIDEKIDELEQQYKFGQEVYKGCPMHNIKHSINILKELKKELSDLW